MDELQRLITTLEQMEALMREQGDALHRVDAERSGWSAAQHFYHLALATDLGLRNVRSLAAGKGRLIDHEAPPSTRMPELVALGHFPEGAQAPRIVTPPDAVNPEFLATELAAAREAAARLLEAGTDLASVPGRVVHQDLGALDASQWATFARMHAEHHLALGRRVLGLA
ncbi:MAG: DinB family protein [Planctomycetes bacterium]|nr:DinB family protein [Planctomycetota bacterium]MDA0947340.1 DinB family protein [Planctomycetota bacterium]